MARSLAENGPEGPPGLFGGRIVRISRVVSVIDRAEEFHRALGFNVVSRGPVDPATLTALGAEDGDAAETVLRLGGEEIALVHFTRCGRPCPRDNRSDDLWFQHLAIVVRDMDAAYAVLCAQPGWQPITIGGPQTLPPANGAVRAFKFRDPDGHPLELIWFSPGQGRPVWQAGSAGRLFVGIDHSALSISSTPRSLAFYTGLGFHMSGDSINRGPAQERLDALPGVEVHVTGLRLNPTSGPGLELLAYRPPGRPAPDSTICDQVTDWVSLATELPRGTRRCALRDPDGHRLLLVDQRSDAIGRPA
jgi:catechol 2,3-dioxygenase-like lactoylglutathione lyase family enzyme